MKKYSYIEAEKVSLEYFGGDNLATTVWISEYALKDSQGNLYEQSPADMIKRMASELARIERNYPDPLSEKELIALMEGFRYIVPQGSPMTGIGNSFQIASLSNCFVIGLDGNSDSYGGIFKTDEEQVQLMKRRGGVGHDLSYIRPKGSPVKNSALTSTGLVPFMNRFSNSTREVAQGGRRGALMLTVSISHPDSEDFIDAKLEQDKIIGANVSIRVGDDFMKAVLNNENYLLKYPIDAKNPTLSKEIKARELWEKIIHNAWKSAEPSVLFWDTILKESIPDCYADLGFKTLSTNPCGEIPLCAYDSCRLLAINLYSYVKNPFTPDATFDFDLFAKHVKYAQRIMDDIVDLETEKIDAILQKIASDPESDEIKRTERELWEKIRKKTLQGRRVGIGITAVGDMIAAMGLRYGTEEATRFAVEVQKTLALNAYRGSIELAKQRGAFEIYNAKRECHNPFIKRIKEADPKLYEEMTQNGRRNIALLTIASTGSTSIMTQTSSGIEPVFRPVYLRRRKINPGDKNAKVDWVDEMGDCWEEYIVYHHKFLTWMKVNGYDTTKKYTQREIDLLIEKSPYYRATANEVDCIEKVKMQGAIQQWVDHSISVTINLPKDTTEKLINELYITAWRSGCKGCTVYREGSRKGVLISSSEKIKKSTSNRSPVESLVRPASLEADVVRFQNNKEKWIAFVGLKEGKPYEIFTGLNDEDEGILVPKSISHGKIIKNCEEDGTKHYDFQFHNKRGLKVTIEGLDLKFNPEFWNYAKLISGVLRYGMPIEQVVNLVQGLDLDDESISTWKNGVERALRKYITSGQNESTKKCPNCGQETLVYQEGYLICTNCGNSKCS